MSPLLFALLGCTPPDFAEEWQLDRLRLLAVRAEPAEPKPGDIVTFTSLAFVPDDADWSSVWFGCMDGDTEGCTLDPELTAQLEHADELSQAELIVLLTTLREAGFIGIQPGMDLLWSVPDDALDALSDAEALEGLSATVTVALTTESDDELTLKRVPVSRATTPNQNPNVEPLTFDGNVVTGDEIVAVDANNDVDVYARIEGGAEHYSYVTTAGETEDRTEDPTWRWYASGGTLTENTDGATLSFDDGGSVASDRVWTTPNEAGEYTLAAVALDGRGGMGWQSLTVTVR